MHVGVLGYTKFLSFYRLKSRIKTGSVRILHVHIFAHHFSFTSRRSVRFPFCPPKAKVDDGCGLFWTLLRRSDLLLVSGHNSSPRGEGGRAHVLAPQTPPKPSKCCAALATGDASCFSDQSIFNLKIGLALPRFKTGRFLEHPTE